MTDWPRDVLEALDGWRIGAIVENVPFVVYGAYENGLPLRYPPGQKNPTGDDQSDDTADDSSADRSADEPPGEEPAAPDVVDFPEAREFGAGVWDGIALEWKGMPEMGVITSQTCDLNEEGEPLQPWFQMSPLHKLPVSCTGKTLPGFMYRIETPVGETGEWAIDLRVEVPVEKTVLVGRPFRSAFRTEADEIRFADALGRRRDRAALATSITSTVGHTLRERRRKKDSFKKVLRNEVFKAMLNVEEGTRSDPTSVRVHVIYDTPVQTENGAEAEKASKLKKETTAAEKSAGDEASKADAGKPDDTPQPSKRLAKAFDDWWSEAYPLCAANGINLLPNGYHHQCHTDLSRYDTWIHLDLG